MIKVKGGEGGGGARERTPCKGTSCHLGSLAGRAFPRKRFIFKMREEYMGETYQANYHTACCMRIVMHVCAYVET
jgi:hypothetical protein